MLFASLIFFFGIFLEVESQFKMVLIFGQPSNWNVYTNRTGNIKSCTDYCYSLNTCVAVYVEKDAKNCWVFNVGHLLKLRERPSAAGHKIAVKMDAPKTCSKTAIANSMTGSVTTDTSYLTYKITIDADDGRWIFTTTSVLNCPTNYRLFTRPKGLWCIGVVSVNLCISQEDSASKCASQKAVLSGLQTMAETNYVYGIGQALLKKDTTTYNRYGYWVNGLRKASCMPPAQRSSSCNGVNEFTYTDPLLSAYDGYTWAKPNQPDGILLRSMDSNCLNLLIARTVLLGLDDNGCTKSVEGDEICYKGYVCGVKPS